MPVLRDRNLAAAISAAVPVREGDARHPAFSRQYGSLPRPRREIRQRWRAPLASPEATIPVRAARGSARSGRTDRRDRDGLRTGPAALRSRPASFGRPPTSLPPPATLE